jgi:CRP-like cAMP-binding protein
MFNQAIAQTHFGEILMPADASEVLFFEGDPSEYVFELRHGIARGINLSADGDRQVTAFFFAGDQIGLPVFPAYRFTAEAVTSLTYVLHSRTRWHEALIRSCRDQGCLLPSISTEQDPMFRRGIIVGRRRILTRICALLVSIVDRLPKAGPEYAGVCRFPLTQIDIADYLATTPETICRGFRQLRERRIIAQPARDMLIVQNRALLEAIASGAAQ